MDAVNDFRAGCLLPRREGFRKIKACQWIDSKPIKSKRLFRYLRKSYTVAYQDVQENVD